MCHTYKVLSLEECCGQGYLILPQFLSQLRNANKLWYCLHVIPLGYGGKPWHLLLGCHVGCQGDERMAPRLGAVEGTQLRQNRGIHRFPRSKTIRNTVLFRHQKEGIGFPLRWFRKVRGWLIDKVTKTHSRPVILRKAKETFWNLEKSFCPLKLEKILNRLLFSMYKSFNRRSSALSDFFFPGELCLKNTKVEKLNN